MGLPLIFNRKETLYYTFNISCRGFQIYFPEAHLLPAADGGRRSVWLLGHAALGGPDYRSLNARCGEEGGETKDRTVQKLQGETQGHALRGGEGQRHHGR